MNDNNSKPQSLKWTGERYLPEIGGAIECEHIHRYAFASKFVKGKRVLDIASGEGYGSNMLALIADHVIGVDISEEAVIHAQSKYEHPNLEFRVGSAADIPVGSNSVDLIVSFETIEHHDQHEKMMLEIKRVLTTGGLLIISSPNKKYYSVIPDRSNPYHVKELFTDEFDRLLKNFFENVQLLGQRVVYGSLFVPQEASNLSFKSMARENEQDGLSRPVYDIAVASDMGLPEFGGSLFEIPIDGVDAAANHANRMTLLGQGVIEPEGQIASLKQVVAERDRQIFALEEEEMLLNQVLHSRSWKITRPLRFAGRILRGEGTTVASGLRTLVKKRCPTLFERIKSMHSLWLRFWLKSSNWISVPFVDRNRIWTQSISGRDVSPSYGRERFKIAAITMVYNEACILPYFLRHYKYLDEIHVLYETDSTDESLEILNRAQNVVVKKCHIEGGIDDIEKINIINNTLHGIEADWVYVVDPDELIFPPNESPYDFLKRQNYDVVRSTMYQVYRHRTDKDLDPLLSPVPQRIHGDPELLSTVRESNRAANSVYIKPNVVRPSSKVRFFPGHHQVYGNPHISPESYVGAHWQMADPSIAVLRRMERKARISERNKAHQMGWQHYDITKDWISGECERHLEDPIIDALCSFSE